jgi:two-component system cell cycle sensor histidine kinase/response regulator CckA
MSNRKAQGEDADQPDGRAQLLSILSLALPAIVLPVGIFNVLSDPEHWERLGFTAATVGMSAAVQWLLRRGRARSAAALFVGFLWLLGAAWVPFGGGTSSLAYTSMVVLVLMASLVASPRAGFVVAVGTGVWGLVVALAEGEGMVSSAVQTTAFNGWATSTGLFLLAATIIYLSVRATERAAQARQSKFDTETRHAALLDRSPDAILTFDLARRVTTWNAQAVSIFGVSAENALGCSLTELGLLSPDDLSRMSADLDAAFAGETSSPTSYQIQHPGGHTVEVELNRSAFTDSTGRTSVQTILRDVTDQRELELLLRQSQKVEAVGHLAGGVAHDFNNLLTIIGCVESARDDAKWEDIKTIGAAANEAAKLTKQLVALAQRQVLKPRPTDLNDLITGMVQLLGRALGDHITIETDLDEGLWFINVDASQIHQVVLNLALHARDAMPRGGEIRIESRNLSGDPDNERVELRLSDTGPGIKREDLEHVFEPFFTTKPLGKGTGLGLSTALGIANQSGGTLHVESVPPAGACFILRLPRCVAAPSTAPEPSDDGAPASRQRVLLVDDNPIVKQTLVRIFEHAGYDVVSTSDPEHAITLVRSDLVVDLLVTDVMMPRVSGPELVRRIRLVRPALPVLFISGHAVEALGLEDMLAQGAGFLSKPFTSAHLFAEVQKVLGRAGR